MDIYTIHAVLPQMKKQGKGIIYNVSSGVGITGFERLYGYASTKGAIEALTRSLSIEFEPYNICVNLIHPPLMNTRSASPLGVPQQIMEDPRIIGKKIAKKILSNQSFITPNFKTSLFVYFSRRYPKAIGKLMSKLAKRSV